METNDIKDMIEKGLAGSVAHVDGDGRHFEATVISDEFSGKNLLEKHRMVYATLGDSMQGDLHALSIRAYTNEEWSKHKNC